VTTRKRPDPDAPPDLTDDDPQEGPGVDDDVYESIDENPLEPGEERPERDREDPNVYPDPDNPPRTP
jgi:hypothetical protein